MYDAFLVVLISVISAFISEGVSWLLIYRTEEYQRLKKSVDSLAAKLEGKKKKVGGSTDDTSSGGSANADPKSKGAKAVSLLDEQLKMRQRDLSMSRMKSTIFVGIILLGVFGLLNHLFDGIPVARLPFEPFGLIRGITHRGLSGSDYYDCSFLFVYILCSMSLRAMVAKALGFTPKSTGAPSMWGAPPQ